MATFIERVCYMADWETDGGPLDADNKIPNLLQAYGAELLTSTQIATALELTAAQAVELEEILETMPPQPTDRESWAIRTAAILWCGQFFLPGFLTTADVRTKLGLSATP